VLLLSALVALAHSLIAREVIDEDALASRMEAVRARLESDEVSRDDDGTAWLQPLGERRSTRSGGTSSLDWLAAANSGAGPLDRSRKDPPQ
jgi:hypothetical protein